MAQNWTTIIKPRNGWLDLNFAELWQYRDLVALFVRRNFVVLYKQSILGPLWFFIQPLLTTIVFTVIFGNIAQIPTDGLPQVLFYMAGTIMWTYFSTSLNNTSETFVANSAVFGKVYFPRLTVPLASVITNIFTFLIQFGTFLAFMAYYYSTGTAIKPNWWALALPLLLIEMAALGMGLGIWISALTTKYRDLKFLVQFGIQLWMYATPVVYPLSIIPAKWHWLMALNPMCPIIEIFKYGFLGQGTFSMISLGISVLSTLVVLLSGVVVFSRIEKTFMDTI